MKWFRRNWHLVGRRLRRSSYFIIILVFFSRDVAVGTGIEEVGDYVGVVTLLYDIGFRIWLDLQTVLASRRDATTSV